MYISKNLLSETVKALKNEKTDLFEYINLICDRIEKTEPFIKALLPENNRRERLLKEAEKLKTNFPDINKRPALYGVPVGVKDIYRVDGFETKAGSQLPAELFKGKESSVVTALKKAGALILGKTVTTEFAFFEPGSTCNPHNINHTPGGSSSGSAAAVACGYTPLALGTQTIGSITRPASFCGVYGCKPSFGRISSDGVIPFSESADHIGFFTQDFDGIIHTASILCENWRNNITISKKLPVIGVATGKYLEQADDEVRNFFEKNLEILENNGCKIIHIDVFEDIEKLNITHRKMVAADFYKVHKSWFAQYENLYRENTRKLILEGKEVNSETLYSAKAGRESLRLKIEQLTKENNINLWLSPSALTAATKGLASTGSPMMNLPWTYTGLPTVSMPVGKNKNNLPLGLQFAGGFMGDEELMGCLKKIEI